MWNENEPINGIAIIRSTSKWISSPRSDRFSAVTVYASQVIHHVHVYAPSLERRFCERNNIRKSNYAARLWNNGLIWFRPKDYYVKMDARSARRHSTRRAPFKTITLCTLKKTVMVNESPRKSIRKKISTEFASIYHSCKTQRRLKGRNSYYRDGREARFFFSFLSISFINNNGNYVVSEHNIWKYEILQRTFVVLNEMTRTFAQLFSVIINVNWRIIIILVQNLHILVYTGTFLYT